MVTDEDPAKIMAREDYAMFSEEGRERIRFQVEFSHAALRNLQLVNGGALIALLTFLGNSDASFDFRGLWWAFFWFGSGLVSSLAAYFGAFFSQHFYMIQTFGEAWNAQHKARGLDEPNGDTLYHFRLGNIALATGIVLATCSLVFFVAGAFVALFALR